VGGLKCVMWKKIKENKKIFLGLVLLPLFFTAIKFDFFSKEIHAYWLSAFAEILGVGATFFAVWFAINQDNKKEKRQFENYLKVAQSDIAIIYTLIKGQITNIKNGDKSIPHELLTFHSQPNPQHEKLKKFIEDYSIPNNIGSIVASYTNYITYWDKARFLILNYNYNKYVVLDEMYRFLREINYEFNICNKNGIDNTYIPEGMKRIKRIADDFLKKYEESYLVKKNTPSTIVKI
jgi:hypothetical protein